MIPHELEAVGLSGSSRGGYLEGDVWCCGRKARHDTTWMCPPCASSSLTDTRSSIADGMSTGSMLSYYVSLVTHGGCTLRPR